MEFYLTILLDIETFVENLKRSIHETQFREGTEETSPLYLMNRRQTYDLELLRDIIKLNDFFQIEILDTNKKGFENWIGIIEKPAQPVKWTTLERMFGNTTDIFQEAKQKVNQKIGLLDEEETNRLNEAFNCYIQELNYSSIVMSVSAIESRLFSLMVLKQPEVKLEKFTLGDLVREYLENKETYGGIIPYKHLPLLQYCNTYRVFSVHPKKEKINRANATAILCMTCSFLFDEKLKTKI